MTPGLGPRRRRTAEDRGQGLAPTCRNTVRQAAQEGAEARSTLSVGVARSGTFVRRARRTPRRRLQHGHLPRLRLSTHAEVRAAVFELIEGVATRNGVISRWATRPPLKLERLHRPASVDGARPVDALRAPTSPLDPALRAGLHAARRDRFSTSNREFLHLFFESRTRLSTSERVRKRHACSSPRPIPCYWFPGCPCNNKLLQNNDLRRSCARLDRHGPR